MAENKGEATFRINIDGNASAASKDVAVSARQAAQAIEAYENEVKSLNADLRRLRGNSDEVNATKAALKKRIDEAKSSAAALTVELVKQGTTFSAASKAAKKYGDDVGKLPNLKSAISKALGATGRGASRVFEPLKKGLGAVLAPIGKKIGPTLAPAGKALAKLGKAGKAVAQDVKSVAPALGGALKYAAGATAAAIAAVTVATVGAGAALAAFGLSSADSAAKMQRQRQALLGNATDAKALGDQISVLAGRVPQGTEELNELGRALSKTRLSGKAIVDSMASISQATGAVDAEAGGKIQELITRFQNVGRFGLQQLELQGTGIDFDDVARAYAEGTKKSVEAARGELMRGEATLDAGAEAMRKAAEKKFGALNLKNAFSLENGPKKLKEQLALLTSGVDLTPISKGLEYAFGQLDENAPLGRAVKTFTEAFGTGLVDIAGKSIPVLIEGIKWLLVYALKLGTEYYETKKRIKDAFAAENWFELGLAIPKGIAKGILAANTVAIDAAIDIAKQVKNAFTGKDGIDAHSPSKAFERYGKWTTEGYAQGVESGSQRASGAVQGMVQMPAASGASSAPVTVEVNIHGASTHSAESMQSPAFRALLTAALRDALSSKGMVAA